ncbi:multidrug efflux MFS transporter [Fodinicola feengrottensis]|uniref:Multidrug efflux MFS transporter n=1 Tax=Fodinicola feengrottensis TaxID=435914 RepID=A0ABP4U0X6_9ACTN
MAQVDQANDTATTVNDHWKRNLVVCLVGSFTTIVAMTLLLPSLPLYVEQLGVRGHAAIVQWSGIAYSATFLTAALTAPIWGMLADRYGRKSMLIRASLGMAIVISLIGLSQNIWQLVGLRLLVGLVGGYASGSTIMVAAQTPKSRTAWALGVLSGGVMAGNIAGPLIGGVAAATIGIRQGFFAAGGLIFLTFLATCFLLKEKRVVRAAKNPGVRVKLWSEITRPGQVIVLLGTASLLMFATMSIEPIITVFVQQLTGSTANLATISGIIMAVGAAGSILSAPRLGRLADRVGHITVIIGCLLAAGVLLFAQAAATNIYELGVLRLLMGFCLGGLLPCIAAAIRHRVPNSAVGQVLGYSVSAQYAGQVLGPILGGLVGGHLGMRTVFVATAVILLAGAALTFFSRRKVPA